MKKLWRGGGADAMTFKVSEPSAEHIRSLTSELGAVLTGRRTFEVARDWGGNAEFGSLTTSPARLPSLAIRQWSPATA